MISICTTKKQASQCKLNGSGILDLIGMISSTSFTQPTTLGKRHNSLPYNILCASPRRLHPNITFPQDSQVRVPKLGLFVSQNFGHSYISQIKFVLKMQWQYLIALENIFPTLYSMLQLDLIWPLLSKDLWSRVKFPI